MIFVIVSNGFPWRFLTIFIEYYELNHRKNKALALVYNGQVCLGSYLNLAFENLVHFEANKGAESGV